MSSNFLLHIPSPKNAAASKVIEAIERHCLAMRTSMTSDADEADVILTTTREESVKALEDGKGVVQVLSTDQADDTVLDLTEEYGNRFASIRSHASSMTHITEVGKFVKA